MTILDEAREHLRRRAIDADNAGDWRAYRFASPLHDVADHLCRIGDHSTSGHYCAKRAGYLVAAALRVRRAAFERYGHVLDQPVDEPDPIGELTDLALDVERAIGSVFWVLAREGAGGRIPESTARELRSEISALARWAERAPTRPDDDE